MKRWYVEHSQTNDGINQLTKWTTWFLVKATILERIINLLKQFWDPRPKPAHLVITRCLKVAQVPTTLVFVWFHVLFLWPTQGKFSKCLILQKCANNLADNLVRMKQYSSLEWSFEMGSHGTRFFQGRLKMCFHYLLLKLHKTSVSTFGCPGKEDLQVKWFSGSWIY